MLILKDALVLFTGTLGTMTRSEAKQAVERMGGKVVAAISDKTNFVVKGDGASQFRLDAAARYNVKVMDEKAFLFLIKENN